MSDVEFKHVEAPGKKPGRKPKGDAPMTAKERQHLWRQRLKGTVPREGAFWSGVEHAAACLDEFAEASIVNSRKGARYAAYKDAAEQLRGQIPFLKAAGKRLAKAPGK